MDIVSIATIILSALGIVVALTALMIQTRQNNIALGVNILRGLEESFHWSDGMRSKRLAVATFLLNRKEDAPPSSQTANILDFFDIVGLYHKNGVIRTDMTWSMFYYWVGHYWQLLKADAEWIEGLAGGVDYYKNFRHLYYELSKYGRRWNKLPLEHVYFTPKSLRTFLEEEIQQCSPQKEEMDFNQLTLTKSRKLSLLWAISFGQKSIWIGVSDNNQR